MDITIDEVTEEDFDLILEILQNTTVSISDTTKIQKYYKLYSKIQRIVAIIKEE
jgi:hypothetical protein